MVKVSGNSRSQSAKLSPSSGNDAPKLDKNQILVKKGDSLWAIAKRELGDPTRWREIAAMNNIKDPRLLQAGQKLTLPLDARPDQMETNPRSQPGSWWKQAAQQATQHASHAQVGSKSSEADQQAIQNARTSANTFSRGGGKTSWSRATRAASVAIKGNRTTGINDVEVDARNTKTDSKITAEAKARWGSSREASLWGAGGSFQADDKNNFWQRGDASIDAGYVRGSANASAGAKWGADGPELHADAGVSGRVSALNVRANAESKTYSYGALNTSTSVGGEVNVLTAEAAANVEAGLNLKKGDAYVGGKLAAGAYVAKATAHVRQNFGVTGTDGRQHNVGSVQASGGVSYGIGAEVSGKAGIEDGKVVFKAKVGAALGIGLEGQIGVEIDVKGAYNAAEGYVKEGAKYVSKKASETYDYVSKKASETYDYAAKKATQISNSVSSTISSGASYLKKAWNSWW